LFVITIQDTHFVFLNAREADKTQTLDGPFEQLRAVAEMTRKCFHESKGRKRLCEVPPINLFRHRCDARLYCYDAVHAITRS